jgi:hypothetical protein
LFDFDTLQNRDITETITPLERMSKFVIANLTDPSSVPAELQAIVPDSSVAIVPIIQKGHYRYSMLSNIKNRHREQFLDLYYYEGLDHLLQTFDNEVLVHAERRVGELSVRRRSI